MDRDLEKVKDLRLLHRLLFHLSISLFIMLLSFEMAGANDKHSWIAGPDTVYIYDSFYVRPFKMDPPPDPPNHHEMVFYPIIHAAAGRHMIDPALIKAVIKVESRFDPDAVSKKGAKGLMQLMPKTAEALGVIDPLDPRDNINGGAKYLKNLLKRFKGNLKLALAAYHAGCGKVSKFKGMPPYKTTQRYVRNVLEHYHSYKAKTSFRLSDNI